MANEYRLQILITGLCLWNIGLYDAAPGEWKMPLISGTTRSGSLDIPVAENAPVGQTRVYVEVEGATNYRILSQPVDGLFVMQNNGSINLTSRLDYEKTTAYSVVIEATYGNDKTTATVTILVEDKNDNPPVFPGSPYFVTVPNNIKAVDFNNIYVATSSFRGGDRGCYTVPAFGTYVTRVYATDADRSFYQSHIDQYSLRAGDDADHFFIVGTTGEIFVGKDRTLSRSVKVNYTFQVQAQDTGSPYRTGSGYVTVCVGCPSSAFAHALSSLLMAICMARWLCV